MSTTEIEAIDVHGHFGVSCGGISELVSRFTSADGKTVAQRARRCHTRLMIVSPLTGLFPRLGADPEAGNDEAAKVVDEVDGLMQWVIVDPLKPRTYAQADEMLKRPKCLGIKIHPEEHGYPIKEHGRVLFEFAAKHRAIVLTHSGQENSVPQEFVPFANAFPEVTLILAHLGNTCDDDRTHHVRAIQAGKHDNMFVDTSSAMNIIPGLLEWAVEQIGAERLLYGTDTPLYFLPMQRARIDHAEISDQQKRLILHDNAAALFGAAVQ